MGIYAAKRFDKNTVFILDSWDALTESIAFRYCLEKKIDLTEAEKVTWDGYGWAGRLATFMLEKLVQLPCHVIVVGHASMYEKRDSDGKVMWSRMQIKSTSNPHAMTIGEKFTDVLYFHNLSSQVTKIDAFSDSDREGGSRIVPPKSFTAIPVTLTSNP